MAEQLAKSSSSDEISIDEHLSEYEIVLIVSKAWKYATAVEIYDRRAEKLLYPHLRDESLLLLRLDIPIKYEDDSRKRIPIPGQQNRTLKFFVKILQTDKELELLESLSPHEVPDILFMRQTKVFFKSEVFFYQTIRPVLMKGYWGLPWSPYCYYFTSKVLVTMYLEGIGYRIPASKGALSDKQVESALTSLANFHAASMIAEVFYEEPLGFIFRQILREKMYCPKSDREKGFEVIEYVVEQLGFSPEQLKKVYRCVCKLLTPNPYSYRGLGNVINHGHPYGGALQFDKSLPCMLTDFFTMRYASPCCDLALFMYMNTTAAYRQANEVIKIKRYARQLREAVKFARIFKKISVRPLPTLNDAVREYYVYRIIGMAEAVYACIIEPLKDEWKANCEKNAHTSLLTMCSRKLTNDEAYAERAREALSILFEDARTFHGACFETCIVRD